MAESTLSRKICCRCKSELAYSMFSINRRNNDGMENACKICLSLDRKNSYNKNKESLKCRAKAYYEANKESCKANMRKYNINNRIRINARKSIYDKNKTERDTKFRVVYLLRRRLYKTLRGQAKNESTIELLGADLDTVISCIGEYRAGFHLDHICPMSQAKTKEEVLLLQHYTNLQWISATDNLQKGDSRTSEGEALCLSLLGRAWEET